MPVFDTPLPIDAALGEIIAALLKSSRLVLAAPPGAGKTTRIPLALLDEDWCKGRIIMLEPRRIAARMAAERMAATLGERVGDTIGLSTRIDRRVSKATRIEVVTDGLFTRRIVGDPSLEGVSAVLFDEIHERSLAADTGLAFALDAQAALREDLRIILMSATLDTEAFAKTLDCPVVESAGRSYPVETRYLGRSRERAGEQVAAAVRRALREEDGSILAFLPGAAEIRRAEEALRNDLPGDASLHPLFGALSPKEQDAAVHPARDGHRKIVLATDIAESSLTIEGVRVVVDAGLARVPVFDPNGGASRLETVRASRASVDQRRGRAGRTQAGVCFRLWDEAETRGLPHAPEAEILNADLSGLRLSLAEWGERDASNLTWLDPPPAGRLAAAESLLEALGALDETGALTDKGRTMASLPLSPRFAALVASASHPGDKALAAQIAALAGERGVGGSSTDLASRLSGFAKDNSPRAKALKRQAERWSDRATPKGDAGALLAHAWPDRIARARPGARGRFALASGQAGRLDETDPLAGKDWLVVIDMVGGGANPRITLAATIDEATALSAGTVERVEAVTFDTDTQTVRGRMVKRLGAITLSESPLAKPSGEAARTAVLDAISEHGFSVIGLGDMMRETLARIALVRTALGDPWPDWTKDHLKASAADWLGPLIGAGNSLLPSAAQVRDALVAQLDWPLPRELSELAPPELSLPSGRSAPIRYDGEQAPLVEGRAQEFYGLSTHPALAGGRVPVTVSLLSPARRQIALTRDLPGFWSGGYGDMAKDMRAQYPKHDWPNDPASAMAHEGRTKARLKS